ncbi:AMT [Mytilus edulis]|uniref:Amt n=1 Tax=Mytilus edulis TaxID=6550 RepID=A0A8S3RF06_MYTED|nr:AMT [Mytilus edulis]
MVRSTAEVHLESVEANGKLLQDPLLRQFLSSCIGGVMAFLLSFLLHKRKFDVQLLVNGILGSLVSITGICAVTTTWAAILIGAVGACVTTFGQIALVKMKGGGFYLLGVQTMAAVAIIIWSVVTSFIVLKLIDLTIGLRLTLEEELYGADYCEHNVELPPDVKEYAESVLRRLKEKSEREKKSKGNVPRVELVNSTPDHPTDNSPARDTEDLILENINKSSDEEATDNDDKVRKNANRKKVVEQTQTKV